MGLRYEMGIEIERYSPKCVDAIKAAAENEWPFSKWYGQEGTLNALAEGSLCGGESEKEFTERLSLAIWQANGAYCEVTVNATYLEELPYEIHYINEDDYERLIKEFPARMPGPQ
jgi:hypothetical protein